MMEDYPTVRLRLDDAKTAIAEFGGGLRHGVLTVPASDELKSGLRVRVHIDARFAREVFNVEGEVAEVTPEGATVFLDLVPIRLSELVEGGGDEDDAPLEDDAFEDAVNATLSQIISQLDDDSADSMVTPESSADSMDTEDSDGLELDSMADSMEDDERDTPWVAALEDGDSAETGTHEDSDEEALSVSDWDMEIEDSDDGQVEIEDSDDGQVEIEDPDEDPDDGQVEIEDSSELDMVIEDSSELDMIIEDPSGPEMVIDDPDEGIPAFVAGVTPALDAVNVWLKSDKGQRTLGIPVPDERLQLLPAIPRLDGVVEDESWSGVLLTVLRDQLTGVLVVVDGEDHCWLYCRSGYPVHVVRRPAPPLADLEHRAIQGQWLDGDVAHRCQFLAQATGRPLMSVIMRLGLLDEGVVNELRESMVNTALLEMLREVRGHFQFFDMPEVERLFHHTPAAVIETLLRWSAERHESISDQRARDLIQRHGRHHVFLTATGEEVRDLFRLAEDDVRILQKLVDRDANLASVANSEDGNAKGIIRLVLALYGVGFVDMAPVQQGAERERLEAERTLRALANRLQRDLFSLVGCHWGDDPVVLQKALEKAWRVVDAVPRADSEAPDLAQLRREINAELDRAERTLLRVKPRRDYRENLISREARQLAAEQRVREAAAHFAMEQPREARIKLKLALELISDAPDTLPIRKQARQMLEEL